MKLLRTLTLLLTGLLFTLSASAQKATEPVAYRLVDSVGRPTTFDKLITRAAGADVVFFGELHNNPISHWMQLRVLEALQQRKGKNLTLGLEMLEADIQLILDEYLAKTISPKSYGDEARLWPNYETDYDPVVWLKPSRMPPWATASASTSALSTPSSTSTAPTTPCRMVASSPTYVAMLPRHAS